MKTLFLTLLFFSITAFSNDTKTQKQNKMPIPKGRLSTDVRFDDQLVNGKFQNSFEAVSIVEDEKELDDLIGIRTSFKDRIKKSEGMR